MAADLQYWQPGARGQQIGVLRMEAHLLPRSLFVLFPVRCLRPLWRRCLLDSVAHLAAGDTFADCLPRSALALRSVRRAAGQPQARAALIV